jgi:hypothetical protein
MIINDNLTTVHLNVSYHVEKDMGYFECFGIAVAVVV